MTVKNKTNKNYKRSQKGRSMVEMLGVLAIVGVLSVGGVYGYGVAMKKHKANELLHQASMLATTISAQAMTNDGKLPETITTFGNGSYGTFLNTVGETTDKTGFTITISEMDSAVCTQMEKMAGGMVQGASCNETTLTLSYYKNLATTEAEGKNSPTGANGAASECDPACETGQECVGGACVTVTPNSSNGCSKNSDCNTWCENNSYDKCYCAISSDPNYNDSNCYTSFTGTCAKVYTASGISGGYVTSDSGMTWWSAVNFCKAAKTGGKLVSLSDMGITGGYEDDGCSRSSCTGANWSDLQSKLRYDNYWVTDAVSCTDPENRDGCTSGSNNNSCVAFYVNTTPLSSGVASVYRFNGRRALCE